ncbi:MAG: hypothetical protein ABSH00_16765 [Bryobacteraceae bacterium]|jgi:hypothetical protein
MADDDSNSYSDGDSSSTPANGGDSSSASDSGSDSSDSTGASKDVCWDDITLLNDPSGNDPSSVARGNDQSSSENTLDHDPPVGAVFVTVTDVNPADAKTNDGADWASQGVQPDSDADQAIAGTGADAASGASQGASASQPDPDASGASGAGAGAAAGAIF